MRYHDITKDDMKNGDGLRVVLWVAGCAHCCEGCQNPVTWDPEGGLLFDEAAKAEIFEQLDKPYISGITFSGGDPIHPANKGDVRRLMREIRQRYPEKTIWLYTGEAWERLYQDSILQDIDVLVDGEWSPQDLKYYSLEKSFLEEALSRNGVRAEELLLVTIDDNGKMLIHPKDKKYFVVNIGGEVHYG